MPLDKPGVCVGELHTQTAPTVTDLMSWFMDHNSFIQKPTIITMECIEYTDGVIPHWETRAFQQE